MFEQKNIKIDHGKVFIKDYFGKKNILGRKSYFYSGTFQDNFFAIFSHYVPDVIDLNKEFPMLDGRYIINNNGEEEYFPHLRLNPHINCVKEIEELKRLYDDEELLLNCDQSVLNEYRSKIGKTSKNMFINYKENNIQNMNHFLDFLFKHQASYNLWGLWVEANNTIHDSSKLNKVLLDIASDMSKCVEEEYIKWEKEMQRKSQRNSIEERDNFAVESIEIQRNSLQFLIPDRKALSHGESTDSCDLG